MTMTWMTRAALVVVAVMAVAALVAGIAAAVIRPSAAPAPLYTPAQFASLRLRSRLRVGQTLLIRGILRDFAGWPGWDGSGAIAQSPARGSIAVFVVYGPRSGLARLRGLPLVGPLLPPTPDHPLTGKVAVFRVRAVACATLPICYFRTPALQLQDGGTPQ